MAPKVPKETTQITKVELPAWVDMAAKKNYGLAEDISNKPYTPYTGQTVAGTDPLQTMADRYFRQTMGTGQGAAGSANTNFGQASHFADDARGIFGEANRLATAGSKSITSFDRSKYMNPYTTDVIDRSMNDFDRSRLMALKSNASGAIADKTFGGSRSAITDAITNSESIRNAGNIAAQLRQQGFDTSSGLMQGDLNRMLQGAQAKTGAGLGVLQGAQTKIGAGTGFLSSADAANKLRMSNFAGLSGLGDKRQGQTQRTLDDLKSRFSEKQGYDTERLNLLLSSLGMSPYGKTENTVKKESGGGGTDFAQMGAGILSLLPALIGLSERSEKTDIKLVGKDPVTKLKMYAYRYKGDPKTYPKVVGPMAQDIEKLFPKAVGRIGGKRVVDLDVLEAIRG